MVDPRPFDCDRDCLQHSGTQTQLRHLEEDRVECKADRKHIWENFDIMREVHNRRISERVTIKTALWVSGIAVTIFLTVITVVLATNQRIEDKLDNLVTDVKVLQSLAEERAEQAEYRTRMLNEVHQWREESKKRTEEHLKQHTTSPYGKPGQ